MNANNKRFDVQPGWSRTLGATPHESGVNLAEIARIELPEYTNEVFHGNVPCLKPGVLYGYRVHGPYDPENGHRFIANKLLIDPCARELTGEIEWSEAHFAQ
jgi:glycogen operon protein